VTYKNIIKLKTTKAVFSNIAGGHSSSISGDGLDFKDIRPYDTSDDIRHINWSVTSRTKEPATNIFNETKQLDVVVVYLNGADMQFGSLLPKSDIVHDIVAVLGASVFDGGDSLSAIFYNTDENKFYKKTKDRRVLNSLLKEIQKTNNKHISYDKLPSYLMTKIKKRSLVFVVGDFLQTVKLELLAIKHDMRVIVLRDKLEERLSFDGELNIKQFSSNSILATNIDQKTVDIYNQMMKTHDEYMFASFKKYKIKHTKIYTHDKVIKKLQEFLR
jgi:uncharacterized protein (DUF58 family)